MAKFNQYPIKESDTMVQLRRLVEELNKFTSMLNYDSTNRIFSIGTDPNFTTFESDGTIKMVGTATTYNDLYTSIAGGKVPAANFPDWVPFTANTGAFEFKVNDYSDLGTIEVLHDYKEGTNLEVHLHLATQGLNITTDKSVRYQIYYTWANPNSGTQHFTAEASLVASLTIPVGIVDKSAYYLSMGVIDGSTMKIGAQLKFRIKRIASTGIEPTLNPYLGMVGLHYERDTLGSRTTTSK